MITRFNVARWLIALKAVMHLAQSAMPVNRVVETENTYLTPRLGKNYRNHYFLIAEGRKNCVRLWYCIQCADSQLPKSKLAICMISFVSRRFYMRAKYIAMVDIV